tara:strand:- start:2447 stop:3991 length:1545 start_codon:yes stop_codon:yes gene_type:complete
MELMPYIRDRVIKGDSRNNIDFILEAHDAYKYYLNRWNFLGDSYQGGYDYFAGRYLEPYYYESREDYEKRLRQVALDNHVKSVVGIYNSFLFRKHIKRNYGDIEGPSLDNFLDDADLDGRSYDAFMRDVSALTMVYGNVWVVIDKPTTLVRTRAEELQQEIRPYVSMFTPNNVLDWAYTRQANGLYTLTYLKVKEEIVGQTQFIREYTPDEINVYKLEGTEREGSLVESYPNELGKIPAVCVYAQRGDIRGVGVSAVGDIADTQKELYEFTSEIEQIVRLTNHPSLVKTADTEASAGAGSVVQLPQGLDPGLKPYLLQPNGASIQSVLEAMTKKIESIDRMACLGGIRSIESRRLSGIGLQTEFQMLNAKLADFAMNLEHAEEQIWRCWSMYQGTTWKGEIKYPRSFSIQDKVNDVQMLKMAKEAGITNEKILTHIDKMIFEAITEKDIEEVEEEFETDLQPTQPLQTTMTHEPMTNTDGMITHMREMIEQGYTDEQIKQLHPEIGEFFNGEGE